MTHTPPYPSAPLPQLQRPAQVSASATMTSTDATVLSPTTVSMLFVYVVDVSTVGGEVSQQEHEDLGHSSPSCLR